MTRVVVVGAGRMGSALIGGLLRSGWVTPGEIAVAESQQATRQAIAERFAGVATHARPVPAEAGVLAVKPSDAEAAARSLGAVGPKRVLSIMAGVTIARLETWLPPGTVILRAMPNMPAVLGTSASALAGGEAATEEDFAWGEAVCSAFGVVARVPEGLLDAVTGLSGSGPAYVFLLAEAMIDAGVAEGLDREVSRLLVTYTLLGSARMLAETGEPPEALRSKVTSPGGTTAAGVRQLERNGFRSALIEAVAAATARAHELAG